MSKTPKPFIGYDTRAFDFIPLHKPKAKKTYPNGKVKDVGKAPLDPKWTTKRYDSKAVKARCIEEGRNGGIRLRADQLVVDIDPRNGGDDGWLQLCSDLGIDDSKYPKVITGSGGVHLYMSKPADVLIRDTLDSDEYNGVEFKTMGRQVVAAGSIHPNGTPYRWDDSHPPISAELPPVPRRLLKAIERPARSAVTGGGQYTPDKIAEALSNLDAEDFNDHSKWLQIMQACHHASAGEARQEFVDWSTQDPRYAKDAYIIGKRWDSLHAEKNDGVTFRTLNKFLRDAGASAATVAGSVTEDEFEDDPDFDYGDAPDLDFDTPEDEEVMTFEADDDKPSGRYAEFDTPGDEDIEEENAAGYDDEANAALMAMNEKYVCLVDGGKFKIMYQQDDPVLNRPVWLTMDRQSFETKHANRMIMRDMRYASRYATTHIPLGEAWIKWPLRHDVVGLCFKPGTSTGEREKDGWLNLWSGYAYQYRPDAKRKGSWKYLRELMHEAHARGDDAFDLYQMRWIAHMLQKPEVVAETALIYKGRKGTGKGTLGNTLVKLIGAHALAIGSSDQLTGRFNEHMRNLIFLFADEATTPFDKNAESKLKHLITEPAINIEKKGQDIQRLPNLVHVMMASNERWVVPASADERRFVVQQVSDKYLGNDAFFEKLQDELNKDGGSGYYAMMADFMEYELPEGWHPRKGRPITSALIEQKLYTMSPIVRFIYNALTRRTFGFEPLTPWEGDRCTFFIDDFSDAFSIWCRNNNINPGAGGRNTLQLLQKEIQESLPSATFKRVLVPEERKDDITSAADGKAHACILPNIKACIREFERVQRLVPDSVANIAGGEFG